MELRERLRRLPKTELHCHFVSTIRPATLAELAARERIELPHHDPSAPFDEGGLLAFLQVFDAAQAVLTRPEDVARVAAEGVADAVAAGSLRYRELFVNPDDLPLPYPVLIDAMIDGLEQGRAEWGVGSRIVVAIDRSLPASSAVALVETVLAHRRAAVVGIGQDNLTADGAEDALRFRDAYALAERHGLKRTAHVGETMRAQPADVPDAIDALRLDRVDHGYRVVDDPDALARARDSGVPFDCTPYSTLRLSQWPFAPDHRIARMIRAGLPVNLSTDDAVFFDTDIGREYADALPAMGLDLEDATRIARAGFEAAWCDDDERAAMLAEFDAAVRAGAGSSVETPSYRTVQ
ncbi:adenosine deaminase family protein [Amnibacterium endophyticum]|uniref:Adenosine deaminase n=1 Tax=Amnibacterium endophyticum TaxID=2109337 RepID=A0ABW4LFJ4_9MICO